NIFIKTNQNVALLKADGSIIYNKYYTEAGLSKGAKALLKGVAIAAKVGGTATTVAGLGKPEDWKVKDTYYDPEMNMQIYEITSKQMETGDAIAQTGSDINKFAKARHFATQATKNTVYILSKWDEGTGLIVVDKDSGKEIKRIVFNDSEPQYVVDEVEYKVYILVKGKEVASYSLK
ncbi:MAG: hypothetical protein ABUT20_60740, partial [Bacteroidota bacterium]